MIRNTIMGICSERMQIVWGEWQETLLDWTRSSIERKIVTRAAGIGAEERDSVGEGGHRESWEDGGWWLTSWNEGMELWHRFWPVEGMQGVTAGAMANSALQKQQVLQHPLYYLNFHITVSRRKKKIYSENAISSQYVCCPLLQALKQCYQMWNHMQKDEIIRVTFRISGVGASGEAVSVVLFRLTHQNDLPMTLAAGVWDARQHLLLVTHAFWSICSYLASVLHCTVPFNVIR